MTNNLRSEVSSELVKRGFRRVDRVHLLRVDSDWSFCVDVGSLESRSDIGPFVGIRHDDLEKTLSDLKGLPCSDYVASVAANVGYIIDGQYRSWSSTAEVAEVLQSIDAACDRLRPLMRLDKLGEGWKIRGTTGPGWKYREIVLFYLLGQTRLVLEKLRGGQAEFCKSDDEICVQFKDFEKRIRERLSLPPP